MRRVDRGESFVVTRSGVPVGELAYDEDGEIEMPVQVQTRHVDEKDQIGRNDPCWCGSGKKFKKCHGA